MKKNSIILAFLLAFTVPAFSATDSAVDMDLTKIGGSIDKLSKYRGKWVIVNYWATWCPPCIEEMPELQAYHDEHEDIDGVVIGINSEDVSEKKLLNFLDVYSITYPSYVSKPTFKTELGALPGLPTTYVISPAGTIEARQVGGITQEMIENFIDSWNSKNKK